MLDICSQPPLSSTKGPVISPALQPRPPGTPFTAREGSLDEASVQSLLSAQRCWKKEKSV